MPTVLYGLVAAVVVTVNCLLRRSVCRPLRGTSSGLLVPLSCQVGISGRCALREPDLCSSRKRSRPRRLPERRFSSGSAITWRCWVCSAGATAVTMGWCSSQWTLASVPNPGGHADYAPERDRASAPSLAYSPSLTCRSGASGRRAGRSSGACVLHRTSEVRIADSLLPDARSPSRVSADRQLGVSPRTRAQGTRRRACHSRALGRCS